MDDERLAAFVARKVRNVSASELGGFDASVLEGPALVAARFVWARRVLNERLSVDLACRLLDLAGAVRLDDGAIAALDRLHADESRHVAIATAMLERLGAGPPANAVRLRPVAEEPPALALMCEVLTGLVVCETVSAARFSSVLRATDLPAPRACIDLLLRDELAHAGLGFLLLERVLAMARSAVGAERANATVVRELASTLGELDVTIGLDAQRRGAWPEIRPQPPGNPGVVEPAVDAIAFYRAVERRLLPRLEAHGVPARRAWGERHGASGGWR